MTLSSNHFTLEFSEFPAFIINVDKYLWNEYGFLSITINSPRYS